MSSLLAFHFVLDCFMMLNIRKVHILVRHLFNQKDQSAGIFFKEIDGGMEWLWSLIEETVDLYINDNKEFSKRGGEQSFDGQQRRAILKIPMSSTVGLSMGSKRIVVTGVLIVYDCWRQLIITAFPCAITPYRFLQAEEDDGWISS
jgi:hypothetical protein